MDSREVLKDEKANLVCGILMTSQYQQTFWELKFGHQPIPKNTLFFILPSSKQCMTLVFASVSEMFFQGIFLMSPVFTVSYDIHFPAYCQIRQQSILRQMGNIRRECKFRYSVLAQLIYKKTQNEREYRMSIVLDVVNYLPDPSGLRCSFSQISGMLLVTDSCLSPFLASKVYNPLPRGSLLIDSGFTSLALFP